MFFFLLEHQYVVHIIFFFLIVTSPLTWLFLLEHLYIFNERVYFYWNTNISECCSHYFLFSYCNSSLNMVISIGTPPYMEAHIYCNSIGTFWGGVGVPSNMYTSTEPMVLHLGNADHLRWWWHDLLCSTMPECGSRTKQTYQLSQIIQLVKNDKC